MRRSAFVLALLSVAALSAASPLAAPLAAPLVAPLAAQQAPTVVILVRHADKAAAPANDPPLTEVGVARAAALAELLRDARVGAVLHTPTVRTRETARPTAELFGITPEIIPSGPAPVVAAAVREMVGKHAGKTVLVVGHSNTILPWIAALGGPRRPDLCDHHYDGIYTLVLEGGSVRMVEGRYGPPNPPQTAPCATMQNRP